MNRTNKRKLDSTIKGRAPGIGGGTESPETEIKELKKPKKAQQLPPGEFQRNLGVPNVRPGGTAFNTSEDPRDWADRSPKAQEKLQRG